MDSLSNDLCKSFRRKSDSQIKRDEERVWRYKDFRASSPICKKPQTRAAINVSIENARNSEANMDSESGPCGDISPVCVSHFTPDPTEFLCSTIADNSSSLSAH